MIVSRCGVLVGWLLLGLCLAACGNESAAPTAPLPSAAGATGSDGPVNTAGASGSDVPVSAAGAAGSDEPMNAAGATGSGLVVNEVPGFYFLPPLVPEEPGPLAGPFEPRAEPTVEIAEMAGDNGERLTIVARWSPESRRGRLVR